MANRFYQIKGVLGSCVDLDTVVAINAPEESHGSFRVGFVVAKASYHDIGEFRGRDKSEVEKEFTRFVNAWKEYLNG